ncbi:methyltransferase-like protein 27 [Apostichopus japonicus]|uniref:methyltransferase-like protein 27 n=1 Tax=Stichopus japonicus TaxID=307972 RepID=UPI003AB54FE9
MATTCDREVQKSNYLHSVSGLIKQDKDDQSQDIARLYDDWTTSYDEDLEKLTYKGPNQVASILAECSDSKDIRVLDCGSGTGLVGEALKDAGFTNLYAVDISQKSLDIAEKKGIYQKLVCDQVGKERMPFIDNEFDALVCIGCLGPAHISPVAFREWVRIVKPGGVTVFSVRHCYLQVTQGEEELHSERFAENFNEILEELRSTKKMEILTKENVPNFMGNSHAFVYAMKVL